MIKVSEIFSSIQGEGVYTGTPSIFIRTLGCNLRCVFRDSICDTPYTSFNVEAPSFDSKEQILEEVYKQLQHNNIHHIIFTGGEPMMYYSDIIDIIKEIKSKDPNMIITIETNGTISPGKDSFLINLWSISPKLITSVDKNRKYLSEEQALAHEKNRINIKSLGTIIWYALQEHNDFQLKFVYTNEDSVKEIKDIVNRICEYANIQNKRIINDRILLMPEGVTDEELKNREKQCISICMREDWRYCDRLHIRIYGNKRGI